MLDETAVGTLDGAFAGTLIGPGDREHESSHAPASYERPVALKNAYDPDNVFHLNPNVAPSG